MDENASGTKPSNIRLRPRRTSGIADAVQYSRDRSARQSIAIEPSLDRSGNDGIGNSAQPGTNPEVESVPGGESVAVGTDAIQGAGDPARNPTQRLTPKEGTIRGGEDASRIAKALFKEIGQRFNENRKKSKSSAYEQYQRDLMNNLDTFVLGGVMELKEITSTVTNLESFMRADVSELGKSPAQLLGEWLNVPPEELTRSTSKSKSKKS